MNAKKAKLLRKAAQGMGVTEKSAKLAFKHLTRQEKENFLTKVRNARKR